MKRLPERSSEGAAGPRKKRPFGKHKKSGAGVNASAHGLRILHEDGDILVCDKPEGLLSATPPGSKDISAFRLLQKRLGSTERRPRVWIIHRLDREVSGVMVFAVSEAAFRFLKEDFRARRIERSYYALVEGSPKEEQGTVQSFLREDRFGVVRSVQTPRRTTDAPYEDEDEARLSVTHWQVVHRGERNTLLKIRMESGRKHQIRVHLSELGHPIVGDERYGARTNPIGRVGLHAAELSLRHPASGAATLFQSPPPPEFLNAVGAKIESLPSAPAPQQEADPTPLKAEERGTRMSTGWDAVAPWYATLVEEKKSAPLDEVVMPGTLALLAPQRGECILDLACGEGSLARRIAASGCRVTGVDASSELIALAKERSGPVEYRVLDARDLKSSGLGPFQAVTSVMALMNMDPLDPVFEGVASVLAPGGRFVGVILHPAFRAPRQSSWAMERGTRGVRHFRRIDAYLSPGQFEIVMNPGAVAKGAKPVTTWTFHRPLQHYVRLLARHGLALDAIEEWPVTRFARDDAAMAHLQREIPMFLALRAKKAR